MVGPQQGSDSEDVHETSASSPLISSVSSHTTSDHGAQREDASSDHHEDAVIHPTDTDGEQSSSRFPFHLLSACSASSRNMCPFSSSITSREILTGVNGPAVQGKFGSIRHPASSSTTHLATPYLKDRISLALASRKIISIVCEAVRSKREGTPGYS